MQDPSNKKQRKEIQEDWSNIFEYVYLQKNDSMPT